ncbi:hypothetical protein [Arthrobacter sp. D2-10]
MSLRLRESLRLGGSSLPAWIRSLRDRAAAFPWWLQVLLIYGVARLYSTIVLTVAARLQMPSPWAEGSPTYEEFINFWDSGWYARIHDGGYPTALPRGDDGSVLENQWAFYPLFPAAVRVFSMLTGTGWNPGAAVLATLSGAAAALVIYRLFRLRSAHRDALWAVGLVAFLPISPILQIPYAESLHLMLLSLALYLVIGGHYLRAVPVVVLMCLARPAGVPFAAMLGVLLLMGLAARGDAPEGRSSAAGDLLRLAVLAGVCGIAAVVWPVVAWIATGIPDAYVQTETAWRGSELTLFAPWLSASMQLLGPVLGPVGLVLLTAGFAAILLSPAGRRLGLPLQLWCAAYLLYLAAFWNPQTSTFRILLPLFPLVLAFVLLSDSRAYRWLALAACASLQIVWVTWLWAWAPLFGAGDYSP